MSSESIAGWLESALTWFLARTDLTRDALLALVAGMWALTITGWLLGRLLGNGGRRR